MRTLRDYQEQAIREIYTSWGNGRRPLFCGPTGAGKSFTFMTLAKQVSEVYYIVLAVRKRNLVEQLVSDAREFGLDYGVYMSGHPEFNPEKKVQICSIDTLRARKKYPHTDKEKVIIFIDEADESLSNSFCDFIDAYPNAKVGGMTATPFNGLYHFDDLVIPVTAKDLNKKGILVDYKYYVPEAAIDTSDIKITAGEYNKKEVGKKAAKITGDIIKAWLDFADFRPTLVFASNVEVSQKIVADFLAAGIPAAECNAKTPKEDRQKVLSDFRNGKIKLLVNVGLFGRGTDIPMIGCIIDAAPTLSLNLHVQKLGRGSRKNDFFSDCIVIDMAKNVINLGPFYMDRRHLINLGRAKKFTRTELNEQKELMRQCTNCFGCFEPTEFLNGSCPRCGQINRRPRNAKTEKGDFVEVSSEELERQSIAKEFRKLFWQYTNLPYYRKIYAGNKIKIRRVIKSKLVVKYGAKVHEVIK